MNCPNCGAENPNQNSFCDSCGSRLSRKDGKNQESKDKKKGAFQPAVKSPVAAYEASAARPGSGFNLIHWLSQPENFIWSIIWAVAAFILFYKLGMKPLHHDESLHAFYAWELFQGKGYQYNPMMHGPFLFHFNALVYYLFGASDYACRILPAFMGMLGLFLVYHCREYLGKTGAIVAGIMIAISPSFTYFGRFIRNDILITGQTMMMLFGMFKYFNTRQPKYLYLAFLGLGLAFATKEVTYITGAIFCTFLFFRWLWERTMRPAAPENFVLASLKRIFFEDRRQLYWALGIFFGVVFILYTTVFTHLSGFGDAFTKSLSYWLGQHEVQRGSQPVYFYIGLLGLYETLAFFGAMAALVYYSFIKNNQSRLWIALAYGILGSAWWLFAMQGKETFGLIFTLLLVTLGVGMLAYFCFNTLDSFICFLMLWALAAISDYSFAGERMPWLILHPLLPMILLTGRFIGDLWDKYLKQRWLIGLVGGLMATMMFHNTVMLNFYGKGANPAELLVYVQSSPDVQQVAKQLENMSRRLTGGLDMKITCEDYCSWPFAWYLRDFKFVGYPKYSASQPEGSIEKNPVIITGVEMAAPGHDDRVAQLLAADYIAQRYKLRVWWAPDSAMFFNDTLAGKIKKSWMLFFYREPWSGLGSYDMVVYVRKDVAHLYWSHTQE